MYTKIFQQIFDSSIAEDHLVRWIFTDMCVLADKDGVVDMTPDAIARRTNVPLELVQRALVALLQPDPRSRSREEDGRRIVLIDSHRDWGWQIINYHHYRNLRDEESRRAYFRDKKREQRQRHRGAVKNVEDSQTLSTLSTEEEKEKDAKAKTKPSHAARAKKLDVGQSTPELPESISREAWDGFEEMRDKIKAPLTDRARKSALKKLEEFHAQGYDPNAILDEAILRNWRGLFIPKDMPKASPPPDPIPPAVLAIDPDAQSGGDGRYLVNRRDGQAGYFVDATGEYAGVPYRL